MARVARWIGRGLLALLVLTILAVAGLMLWLRSSVPQLDGERALAGLEAPVLVVRDAQGIPHIRAESWADAQRTLGFLHAQDRLFQMEMSRRIARGRLAEIAGSSVANLDRRMRTFGLAPLVEADAKALPPEVLRLFQAYADGVNAFLKSRMGALPPEFLAFPDAPEPWTPADSLLWLKLMGLQLTADWSSELQRASLAEVLSPDQIAELYPDLEGPITLGELPPPDAVRYALDLAGVVEEGAGSNLWLFSGERTDTGKPILANDPHLGFSVPNVWYLVRIETPDGIVAGASAPGFPLVVLGHNGKVAWGLTNAYGDTSDVFVERVDPSDPSRYQTPDGTAAFETREEVIDVRFGEPQAMTVRTSRHGPVISDVPDRSGRVPVADGTVLALAHTALLPGDGTALALLNAQRAETVAEAMEAMRTIQGPQQNVAIADASGTIGLIAPALVPLRKQPSSPLPVLGWDGDHDWTGFIPFEELPRITNPPSGRLVNANNKLVGPDYPYDLGDAWASPLRAEAIIEALDREAPHTVAHSVRVQTDVTSVSARKLLALVDWNRIGDALPADLAAAMQRWDAQMAPDQPEPLLYYAWHRALLRVLYADELGAQFQTVNSNDAARLLHTLTAARHWCDDVTTDAVEDCDAAIAKAFGDAFTLLTERFGDDWRDWRWGEAHQARFRHMLFGFIPVLRDIFDVSVPHGGGRDTPDAGVISFDEKTLFQQVHGAGFRAVYDLADLNRSRFMQAVGQSGNIYSPYYANLLPLWAEGKTLSLAPLTEGVEHRLHLVPAP